MNIVIIKPKSNDTLFRFLLKNKKKYTRIHSSHKKIITRNKTLKVLVVKKDNITK